MLVWVLTRVLMGGRCGVVGDDGVDCDDAAMAIFVLFGVVVVLL